MLEPFVLKGTGYWKDMVASASSYRSSHTHACQRRRTFGSSHFLVNRFENP